MALASGTRRVYNRFYRNKATGGSYAPTPSQIEEYFVSQGFDAHNLSDEQFNQTVHHFSKGELSTVGKDSQATFNSKADANIFPENNQIVVSSADKQALVSTQSAALGFELSEQETIAIADNIDNVFADYSAFVTSVTSAITGYIAHKFDEIEEKLDSSGNDVRKYLADRNFRLNQKLVDYANNVKNIKSDTEEIRENLQTTKNVVLSRFQIK
ncbi:hypothetical protein HCG51_34130 (plasmid) [Tolypothrix sp. PCC 7910]|uniref:hypothetical protein n=1 Tax=Tolypothrix sp. PCC 7910 TaxID=2099387 RepID=UPI0014277CF3|nr:hypothetical protein [Tolypothrix sp. PCC 7910]QIR41730.1 hypothetical protein HCG51_34130 [Tolypothrix sp. PCC 7910]